MLRGPSCLRAAAAAVVTISACGRNPFTPTVADMAGTYSATTFTSTNGATTTDHLAVGGSLTLTLGPDGTTTGRLFVPGGAEGGGDLDADMAGTWTLTGSTVDFAQAAEPAARVGDILRHDHSGGSGAVIPPGHHGATIGCPHRSR